MERKAPVLFIELYHKTSSKENWPVAKENELVPAVQQKLFINSFGGLPVKTTGCLFYLDILFIVR